MSSVRRAIVVGASAVVGTVAAVLGSGGLSPLGWAAGLVAATLVIGLFTRALTRANRIAVTPAEHVTLVRAVIACGVAAMTATAFTRPVDLVVYGALSAAVLVLDWVDGQVARRTRTVSDLGARFDMETDAFLILVLSVLAARELGAWVLVIGLARYLLAAAARVWPWLSRPAPARYWCKVVAAIQGIVLTVVDAGLLPTPAAAVAVATALALLLESFGREVGWLWRHRDSRSPLRRFRAPRWVAPVATALSTGLVWLVLVAPTRPDQLATRAFVRIPAEGLIAVAVLLVLPSRARRPAAMTLGAVVGALTLVKVIDLGFYDALQRPFNPVSDWSSFGSALGVLRDSVGRNWAEVAEIGAVALCVAVIVLVSGAMVRLTGAASRHRRTAWRSLASVGTVWVVVAALGFGVVPGVPLASTSEAGLAWHQVTAARAAVADETSFDRQLATLDRYREEPSRDLLTGLRGKDVIVAFVESYGQVAVRNTWFAPGVDRTLDAGTRSLRAAGYSARSGYLTSPTFGGISWLAHSTLQSGLWVDSQQRYDQLVSSRRFTLSDAFRRAGWRTVGDVPSDEGDWPQGRSFYHYDKVYGRTDVGYRGPAFSYAKVPDQYTLAALQRRELTGTHRPLMAEVDLDSSHEPWAPQPRAVPWSAVGDGSVYDGMPDQGPQLKDVWRNGHNVQAAYARSIRYSVGALVSWVRQLHDPNLVLVMLGDHQPETQVSGDNADHDVPVSIVSADEHVVDRTAPWGWTAGLRPTTSTPRWPMSAFRDRFLAAYGAGGT